jgi:hypothetical protein
MAIFAARGHLREVVRIARRGAPGDPERAAYRSALWVVLVSMAGLVLFCKFLVGIAVWLALAFLLVYVAMYIGLARIRAELGPPMNGLFGATPGYLFTEVLGARTIGLHNYAGLSVFWWCERDVGQHPMANAMEGLKMASEAKVRPRLFLVGMWLAAVVGFVFGVWLLLHFSYKLGFEAKLQPFAGTAGTEVYWRLKGQTLGMPPPSSARIVAFVAGLGFVAALAVLRTRFIGFPLHPTGFVLANIWGNFWTFAPFLSSWVAKVVTLRYGGLVAYRRFSFFFMGLIAGEFSLAVIWVVFQMITGHSTYVFVP